MLPAPSATVAAFVALCIAIIGALLAGVRHSERRDGAKSGSRVVPVTMGLMVWLGALAVIVLSGFVEASPMPRLPVTFIAIMLVSVGAGFSRVGGWLASSVPLAALVGFQAFRLPLELILHAWAKSGTIPETMTWTGRNWDIVSGVTAIVAAGFVGRSRGWAWLMSFVGIALLVNVARVAILSSPLPFAWPVTPPLLLAFHLPYALIVPVCVGGAAFGHVVLLRALMTTAR